MTWEFSSVELSNCAKEVFVVKRVLLSWSSGKDSAWALHVLRQQSDVEVVGLLTTVNEHFERVAMHGVRRTLLEAQGEACGLTPWIVDLPWPCSNEVYSEIMGGVVHQAASRGVDAFAFGDLFLEDIRAFRESSLDGTGLEAMFPLWQINTGDLAHRMVTSGLKAHVTCLDPGRMPRPFAGHLYDASFLDALPDDVDPCGENGEFHTFVSDGPMFRHPVPVEVGETVERDGFVFTDLLPATS